MSVVLTPIPVAPKPAPVAQPQPVQILSFSASASQIEQGQSTTLQWQTANATQVSINNGIAQVDNSGQTTVRPTSSTTYVLTAKGANGAQQRSVNIIVESKAVSAPPPPPPPKPVDETALVRAALEKFNAALAAHNVAQMQAIWPTMKPQQAKGFQNFFKSNRSAKMSDSCASSSLTISGNSADWPCNETTTIISGGRPTSSEHSIHFKFRKTDGGWVIAERQ